MIEVWIYTLLSIFIISLVSLVGVFTLSINEERLRRFLVYVISFSAGALFGDAFLHLLPEVVDGAGFTLTVSFSILAGILFLFLTEKIIFWRHCHVPTSNEHPHSFAVMNLVGDALHNLIDGLVIGAAYLVSVEVGIATTIAVFLHEIPQEIGDFGVLLHGGFSKGRALFLNFMISLTAVLGAIIALLLNSYVENLTSLLVPFAAGGFIYIAGSDLIPELHKERRLYRSLLQFAFFVFGILLMYLFLLFEF
jgi:zinc and cadmium transporter